MKSHLIDIISIDRVMNSVVSGTTVQNSDGVDCEGADGVLFVSLFGALTVGNTPSVKAQSSSDDGAADAYADITGAGGSALADTDGERVAVVDVRNPPERYVRALVDRPGGTGGEIDGVLAIKYHLRKEPSTQGVDVADVVKAIAG